MLNMLHVKPNFYQTVSSFTSGITASKLASVSKKA